MYAPHKHNTGTEQNELESSVENMNAIPDKQSRLQDAMKATDDLIQNSDEGKQEAEIGMMVEALTDQAEKQVSKNVIVEEKPSGIYKSADGEELKTERSLELHRKHQSLHDIRTQMHESMSLLNDACMQSDLLLDFMGKAEIDLIHLEEVEAKSEKMGDLILCVSRRHTEMKLKISKQQKQLELLNLQKSKYRNTIDQARTEINRLSAACKSQANDIEVRDADIAKHKDDKTALNEQVKLLLEQAAIDNTEAKVLEQKLNSQQLQIEKQDKLLNKYAQQISVLGNENDQVSAENKDLQTRFTALNTKFTSLQTQMEEADFASVSERDGLEENLRHGDARIISLENNVAVLNKQLVISEEKIATMNHEFARVKIIGEKRISKEIPLPPIATTDQMEVVVATMN